MVALELKKLLHEDSDWSAFSIRAAETKRLLYSTSGVGFAPPNQRRKDRYMNVDILIGWAKRILEERVKNAVWDKRGGVGRLILSMASRVGEISEDLIKNGLESLTVQGVRNWLENCLIMEEKWIQNISV